MASGTKTDLNNETAGAEIARLFGTMSAEGQRVLLMAARTIVSDEALMLNEAEGADRMRRMEKDGGRK